MGISGDSTSDAIRPECGKVQSTRVVETCPLDNGLTVKKPRHLKCRACDGRFFDDNAMRRIQMERATRSLMAAVR